MKVLISTPLFPPEKHYPAYFAKSFAENLKKNIPVSMLIYGEHPEEVLGVDLKTIKKNNHFLKKFYNILSTFNFIKKHEVIVLTQAGFFSFSVFLLAKILRKKVFLKIKEDESEERKRQFKLTENSLKLKLIGFMQKTILQNSDFIFFDSQSLKETFENRYHIHFKEYEILKHPEKVTHHPFSDWESTTDKEKEIWLSYVEVFLKKLKSLEK
jgi:hypothetical protein